MSLPPEITKAIEDLCVVEKARRDLRNVLLKYWRKHGSFAHAGVFVDKRQTVTQEVPNPRAVARCLLALTEHNDLEPILEHVFTKVSVRAWPGTVKGLPMAGEIFAMLDADEDGGKLTYYGKASTGIRFSAADLSKCVVLEPGDAALVNELQPDEDESDED